MHPRHVPLLLLVLVWGSVQTQAHGLNAAYTEVTVGPSYVNLVHRISVEDLVAHFPVSLDRNRRATPEAIEEVAPAIVAFLAEHLTMTLDGTGIVLEPVSHGAEGDGTFVRFEFNRRLEERPSVVAVGADVAFFERFGPQHANFISFTPDEPAKDSGTFRRSRQSPAIARGRVQQAVITFDRPRATFSTGYRPRVAQSLAFIGLGVRHIFLGYDHFMFLLALIIVGGRLAHLVKVVTAFTVAHSLTLGLAGLQIVMIPARLVEGTIALTIAYVAFDNFFVSGTAHRPVLTFCFGLVHGFGLAHVLHEMDLPRSEIVSTLLSFNIGVELGQLIILAVLFPVTLWIARQRFGQLVVAATSGVTFLCGVGWFVQRLFDWPLMPI